MGTATSVRSDSGTPACKASPGSGTAPKFHATARFTSAVATSVAGTKAAIASSASQPAATPGVHTTHSDSASSASASSTIAAT